MYYILKKSYIFLKNLSFTHKIKLNFKIGVKIFVHEDITITKKLLKNIQNMKT